MATSSYKTFLMYKASTAATTYTKLVDIKDYPDLGGTPELLETTTLSDNMQTNILGIQSLDALEFTANYTLADFIKLKNLEGNTYSFAVWMGGTETTTGVTPTGDEGKYEFDGQLSVFPVGKGVNEVREMTISIAASTVINQTATTV